MKTLKLSLFGLSLIVSCMTTIPFQSCDPDDDCDEQDSDTCIIKKPNIYIYPNDNIQLTIKLDFPLGGEVITSVPNYETGWDISVDTNGLINNTYTYLFYESITPYIWQKEYGWIVNKNELETFFRKNMTNYGFYGKEIDDFIDYWIPRLVSYQYYSIYPQTESLIKNAIVLNFSIQPENILRLFYVIKGSNEFYDIVLEPTIDTFKRERFYATEWGVILDYRLK